MRWGLVGLFMFTMALARSLADGFGLADESWFLHVVHRVLGEDVLYRDVFFGATPLAVYVTTGVASLIGVEIVAVKIITNAAFAVTAVLIARLATSLGASAEAVWVILGALLFWSRPYANPPYTLLALTLFVATLGVVYAAARRTDDGSRTSLACWLALWPD